MHFAKICLRQLMKLRLRFDLISKCPAKSLESMKLIMKWQLDLLRTFTMRINPSIEELVKKHGRPVLVRNVEREILLLCIEMGV